MPQYWLKPLGVSTPPDPLPDEWTVGLDLDSYPFPTGPANPRKPPPMGRGDRIIFHAVVHAHVFAEGEITTIPLPHNDPNYG